MKWIKFNDYTNKRKILKSTEKKNNTKIIETKKVTEKELDFLCCYHMSSKLDLSVGRRRRSH